ncbi:MAG: tRNA dihydrouridine(20/20a) synthase DusA [Gammaproteobacteria bacterium]|nr:tRNA dihydrouridine(20/20a) synthase DusA [Gammaproteobacteria bacterium]
MKLSHKLCVAPMMTHTDRHFRYFLRLLSGHSMLYTEMLTTGALLYGDTDRYARFNDAEHPVGIQLGGSNPADLANCAEIATAYGYDEINLNTGCPSKRVKSGRFGACLMAEPGLVAECVAAMAAVTDRPVTVKTRIGIDRHDSYEHLGRFVSIVSEAGCHTFIIHARKAWLNGLSPRQNRTVPPLRYDLVYRLKQDFPHLEIIINGGITSLAEVHNHFPQVDGVMLGRAVCNNPYLLAGVDKNLFGVNNIAATRMQILQKYIPYMETEIAQGEHLYAMSRHILGLFHGQYGARAYRRHLTVSAHEANAGVDIVNEALALTEINYQNVRN